MYAVFEFRLSRRNTAEVNIGVFRRSCRAAQRRSLKDRRSARFPGEATGDDQRRRPPAGSSRTARREAFIVISRANSSNISAFGPERRVLIFSLGWLSVFVYERPLYFFLYLILSDLLRTSFFAILVFSLSMFVSLSLVSLLFSLPEDSVHPWPSRRTSLVALLLFSYPCLRRHPSPPPHTLPQEFSSSLVLQLASGPSKLYHLPVSPSAHLAISLRLNRPFSISHFLYCATYARLYSFDSTGLTFLYFFACLSFYFSQLYGLYKMGYFEL